MDTFLCYLRIARLYIGIVPPFFAPVKWSAALMEKEAFLSDDYQFDVGDSPNIIDAGSNIGTTIRFFLQKYPKATIVGFEPDPSTFDYLTRNVARSAASGVTLHRVALADQDGEATFSSSGTNPGGSSLFPKKMENAVKVKTARLSTFIKGAVDILKMDIEGAEGLVLKDLDESGKLLLVRNIVLEYHRKEGNSLAGIIGRLEKNGFRIAIGHSKQDSRRFADSYFLIRAARD